MMVASRAHARRIADLQKQFEDASSKIRRLGKRELGRGGDVENGTKRETQTEDDAGSQMTSSNVEDVTSEMEVLAED